MYYNNNNYNNSSRSSSNNNDDANIEQNTQMQAATTAEKEKEAETETETETQQTTTAARATFTSTTRRTTSLIYLPPFRSACKHVPQASSIELSSSQRQRQSQTRVVGQRHVVGNYRDSNSSNSSSSGSQHYYHYNNSKTGSCCCQRHWEHKNYDKHATAATSQPLTTATTMPQQQQLKYRITPNASQAGCNGGAEAEAEAVVDEHAATARNLLQRLIHLPMASGVHSSTCYSLSDLRQQQQRHQTGRIAQLVMPIVVGGSGVAMEYQRRQRRERLRPRERPSHASVMPNNAMAATIANPINSGATTTAKAAATNNSQTTTTTKTTAASATVATTIAATATMQATTGSLLPLASSNDDDDDESRCFNYNGDISKLAQAEDEKDHNGDGDDENDCDKKEQHQLASSITWLKLWQQQLLQGNFSYSYSFDFKFNFNFNFNSYSANATTTKPARTATRMTTTKSWLGLLLMLLFTTSASCWGARQDGSTNCTFPARWEGSWFLSGYQKSIHIKGSQFSYRGRCVDSIDVSNKYLIVDEKGCHRCLVIYEKHKNVLQYKESECEGDSMYMHQSNPSALAMRSSVKQSDHRGGAHPNTNGHSKLSSSDQYIMRSNDDMNDYFCKGRETLQNLCDQIPGDALLYSLFRESAEPVKCPLKGPFIFTYNRGYGECHSPVSNIESCTEESRLLLSFQACPDVHGTESMVEELTCLATWKDGNSRYLVGLVSHHHAISNEERYRCFVYAKTSSLLGGPNIISSKDGEYKLSQSGDATCNGLDSAEVGSRIMSLRKPPAAERCDFPAWFKGPRHWHALMGNSVYNYHSNDGSVHIIKPNGYMETRALCEQINKQTATEMMVVVHSTTGCQSGFMCMMFYRRDTHVIEIQTGKPAIRLEDACAPDHFDINKMAYITLLANNPDPQICPMEGLYNLRGAIGPPYLATRHKRNHNGKSHLGHGHHHLHDAGDAGGFGHKGHSSLSFRNAERIEKGSWHANTRGLPVRSRRNAPNNAVKQHHHQQQQQQALVLGTENSTSVGFVVNRNRRDAPGCVTDYKAQRVLWMGCTEPNVIDVRPMCNVDGEEEYSCHGSWAENGTIYIIARHKGTKHGVCISYRPTEGTAAKLVVGDACYRGTQKPPDHHLVANLSALGKCGETGSSAARVAHVTNWFVLVAAVASLCRLACCS